MRRALTGLACLPLTGCAGDETLTAYGADHRVWRLVEVKGDTRPPPLLLTFAAAGQIQGRTACGEFAGELAAPYPWFEIRPVPRSTPPCRADATVLSALAGMTQSEVSGDVLILRNDSGGEMVFRADG
ncbi:META domain-containing protein [Sedimentitalea sp. CAU 1593]|uniref:META domain-containing protein n=1 Tax=Sedimentitalea arenosa TaxID=2798803 RepID=A0A8J7JB86_9RHOB|nr:META domain-containing protein [Arenibacterium arenosum]